jgi:hypothetical protein
VSPEGIEYACSNRNQFAKQHNLNSDHLYAVIRGETAQHKGWKLKKGVSNAKYIFLQVTTTFITKTSLAT